jgi:hypothetical protein
VGGRGDLRGREPGRGRRVYGAGGGRRVCGSARAPRAAWAFTAWVCVGLGGRQWPVREICPLDRAAGGAEGYVRWVGAQMEWSGVGGLAKWGGERNGRIGDWWGVEGYGVSS